MEFIELAETLMKAVRLTASERSDLARCLIFAYAGRREVPLTCVSSHAALSLSSPRVHRLDPLQAASGAVVLQPSFRVQLHDGLDC